MHFKQVKYSRVYEQIVEQIEQMIQKGELKPGDKLPTERDLAEMLSASRGSIREAFRVLESEGIVLSRPGGGRFIRNPQHGSSTPRRSVLATLRTSTLHDIMEARNLLEYQIIRLACQRATEEDLQAIGAVLDMAPEQIATYSPYDENYFFHIEIAKATHNTALLRMMDACFAMIYDTGLITWQASKDREQMKAEHVVIYRALQNRNVSAALEALQQHMERIDRELDDAWSAES